ncbi:MAG: sigma-54-dependent Fis family transcriptional regulator [Candidatus Marinimicrobia bacterium]|nr:sigma-54-dependent Fis family transcriptional regulator [Candidatus Neomarinimicrobiota bacterium]
MIQLLVVDDDYSIRAIMQEAFNEEKYDVKVCESGESALKLIKKRDFDLVITDLMMEGMSGLELMDQARKMKDNLGFLIITAYGTIKTAVEALQNGAYDFITKPFSISHIKSRVDKFMEYKGLKEENQKLKQKLSFDKKYNKLVGTSPGMQMIFNQIDIVADSDAPVFIQGESGTGKELIAQAIHDNSNRRNQPFIKVNCPAIPETLFESTLFGHEKGAFTNAIKTYKGLFEEADGGTLLLDEITEMPVSMQAKLLRVLQEDVITRVGSAKEIPINVRVIATSNRDIQKTIDEKKFRSDLYFRLNVFPIKVPSLRSRPEDIPVLVIHFINKFKEKYQFDHKDLEKETLEFMVSRQWPGNIRQLENLVERAILYSGKEEILRLEHFSMEPEMMKNDSMNVDDMALMTIAEMEKRMIFKTLKNTGNNRTKAAEILDISVRTLRNKLNQYKDEGLEVPL